MILDIRRRIRDYIVIFLAIISLHYGNIHCDTYIVEQYSKLEFVCLVSLNIAILMDINTVFMAGHIYYPLCLSLLPDTCFTEH